MKWRVCSAVLIAAMLLSSFGAIPTKAVEGDFYSPIVARVIAPEETGGAEAVTVSVELEVPQGTEVYGLDLSLYYEMRYFVPGEYTVQLADRFSAGILQKGDGELQFLYESSDKPIDAGTHKLFAVTFSVRALIQSQATTLDLVVREAYVPHVNNGQLEYIDLTVMTEAAQIFVGERFSVTPEKLQTYVGNSLTLSFNKSYDRYYNATPDIIRWDEQTKTVTALAEGMGRLIFYTRSNEEVEVSVRVYRPDPRLKKLQVVNGTLSPAFDPDTYQYSVTIPWNSEGLDIYAVSSMDGMSNILTENPVVPMGGTKVALITVVAENGDQRIYTVAVTRQQKPVEAPSTITSGTFTISQNTVSRVPVGTTVSGLLAGIRERDWVTVYKANGTRAAAGDKVATGFRVKLSGGAEWTVIVTGDVNGDGKITATDYVNVKFSVLGKQKLTGVYSRAADVNGDGKITASDYVGIKFHVLGKSQITPRA